jgi:hypothetical protein
MDFLSIAFSPLFAIARRGAQPGSTREKRTVLLVALNRRSHEYGMNRTVPPTPQRILNIRFRRDANSIM